MITKAEVVQWLLANCVSNGYILDLSNLDLSEFDGIIDISGMKVKNSLFQGHQEVGSSLFQDHQNVKGDLFQGFQSVSGSLHQGFDEVGGNKFDEGGKGNEF